MRLGIALGIAFCLVLSVSMASALQAPYADAEALEAHAWTDSGDLGADSMLLSVEATGGAGTSAGATGGAGTSVEAAGGASASVEAMGGASASVEAMGGASASVEATGGGGDAWAAVKVPAGPRLPSPCVRACAAPDAWTEQPQDTPVPARDPEHGGQTFLHASPVVWWSTAFLVLGSAATKLWWMGPGRFTWLLADMMRWGFAAALWTRMRSAYMLENENRAMILRYVKERPGASIQEVQQHAGVAWGTAVYHLDRLARAGEVVGQRSRNHHRYWASGTPEARMRHGWALLSHGTAKRIARAVAESPGVHQGAICEKTGVRAPSASKHLARLERGGLVEKARVSRYAVYEATDELQRLLEMQDGVERAGPEPQATRLGP